MDEEKATSHASPPLLSQQPFQPQAESKSKSKSYGVSEEKSIQPSSSTPTLGTFPIQGGNSRRKTRKTSKKSKKRKTRSKKSSKRRH